MGSSVDYDKYGGGLGSSSWGGGGIEKPGVFIDNTYIYINVNGHVLSFVLALNVTNQRSKGEIQTTQLKVHCAFSCNLICDYRSFQYFDLSFRVIYSIVRL